MARMYTTQDARRHEEEELNWDQYYRDIASESKEHREEEAKKKLTEQTAKGAN